MINVTGLGREDVEKMRTFLSKHQGIERDKDVVKGSVASLIGRLESQVNLDSSFSAFREAIIHAVVDYERRRIADQEALELSLGEEA